MKKVFSLLLFLAVQTVLFAQGDNYIPFVEEGKVWYCGYSHPDVTFHATAEDPSAKGIDCIFTMQGDTVINGKTYKKVYCQFKEYYGDEDLHYYCAVREEDYRVYIVEEEFTSSRKRQRKRNSSMTSVTQERLLRSPLPLTILTLYEYVAVMILISCLVS